MNVVYGCSLGKKSTYVPGFCNVGVRLHGMHGIASIYLFHYTKSLRYAILINATITKRGNESVQNKH